MQSGTVTPSSYSRRRVLSSGVGAAAALTLGTAGRSQGRLAQDAPAAVYDGPPVTLEFWNGLTGADGPFMLAMIDRFNEVHENIQVSMNAIPWDEYYQTVPAAVSSGRGPDIGLMHIRTVATNAARQVIAPVDDVVSTLGLTEDDFSPGRWQSVQYNGQMYGIPLDVFAYGYYYNTTAMEAAGLDPANPPMDNAAYMDALETGLANGFEVQWQAPVSQLWQRFSTLVWQFGGDLFNEDVTEATYNSEAGVQALTWMVDLVEKGYSPRDLGPDAEVLGFKNNENALHWNGPWMINDFGGTENLEWGVSALPVIGDQPASWSEGHNFVVFNQRSADEDMLSAANVFIEWAIANAADWAQSGQVPALNAAREAEGFAQLPAQSTLAAQLPDLHFPPAVPGIDSVILEPIGAELNLALLLQKSPEDALNDAVSLANQLLEENRERYQG